MSRHRAARHRRLSRIRTLRRSQRTAIAALASLLAMVGLVIAPTSAYAAGTSVTVTSATTTTPSGTVVTYTMSVTCSVAAGGSCTDTKVTFPSNAITGDGATTDFGSWVGKSSCADVTESASGGVVTFDYGTLASGSRNCTFTVKPPNNTTFDNTKVTITPTISGSNFPSSTGTPISLTVTASHNAVVGMSVPARVLAGVPFSFTMSFFCGSGSGDIGVTSGVITDPLPAGFTYTSFKVVGAPGTVDYDPVANTLSYTDTNGSSCGGTIQVTGTPSTNGVPDAAGTKICNQSTATFHYIDAATSDDTSQNACTTVNALVTQASKSVASVTTGNQGQWVFPGDGNHYPYTFPGNWDGTGAPLTYSLTVATNPATAQAGVSYEIQDPLPCLDNGSGGIYSSPAPGAPYCAHPGFVPTGKITVTGFTPTAADEMTVHFADGTATTVAFAAGGWAIPSSGSPIAEIDFAAFAEEGANDFATMVFSMDGYAAATTPVNGLLVNQITSSPLAAGTTSAVDQPRQAATRLLVADPNSSGGTTVLTPSVSASAGANCTESVSLNSTVNSGVANFIELVSVPSDQLHVDLLAPPGATVAPSDLATKFVLTFTFSGNGKTFTSAPITPTVVADFSGTGRALYKWVIPAGVVTVPGNYRIIPSTTGLPIKMPAGCAGTYHNDITIGYGGQLRDCYFHTASVARIQAPPMNPSADNDLNTNSIGTDQYCGYSANAVFAAVNPGFSVNKTVQGNLDAAPVSGGTIGNVSPTGGTATYNVTFTNTGQSSLDDPVMYDLLPRVGDTDASDSTARNSQFGVAFTGLGTVPAGVTVSYSTAANPCRPEVLPTNPGCTNDWSTTAPSPLSKTTALKFAYFGTVYVTAATGQLHGFSVPFTVSTPAVTAGDVAWNSVGTTATAGTALMNPAESSKTGLRAAAGLTVTKATTTANYAKVGDSIAFTYTVKNTTTVPLTSVGVIDNLVDADASDVAPLVTCKSLATPTGTCSGATTPLAPGQTATFTASYAVTQADVDAGHISDTATATGTPSAGDPLSVTSNTITVNANAAAGLTLAKSATPTSVNALGQQVTFHYLVHNSGAVTVTGVGITEGTFTGSGTLSAVSCSSPSLTPGQDETCTATYPVTQADLDAGSISNTATAHGTAGGGPVTSTASTVTVAAVQTAALTLTKTADPTTVTNVGETVDYDFHVTNSGNVAVTNIAIDETSFTGSGTLSTIDCPSATLAAGDDETCTASYSVTQADLNAGTIKNTAKATGKRGAATVSSDPSSATVTAVQTATLTLVKSANPSTVTAAGQTVTYQFAVTNTGNVAVSDIAIDEQAFSGSGALSAIDCPNAALAPTQSENCSATYQVTQADLDAGSVTNTATATGTAPGGAEVSSLPSTASVGVTVSGGLTLVKSADPSDAASYRAEQPIVYSYAVTNTGNVTVTNIAIDETSFTGSGSLSTASCPKTTLAPKQQMICTADYTLTQADIDSASVENTATATGTAAGGSITSDPSTAATPIVAAPELTLAKSATPTSVDAAGDSVSYEFLVTNTGNVTIDTIAIDETAFSGTGTAPAPSCPDDVLVPGEFETCTATYTMTQADIDAGSITNTATATGTEPATSVVSEPSSALVTAVQNPGLIVAKSADPATVSAAGDEVTWSFLVTNTGNVTLSSIGIYEGTFSGSGPLGAVSCPSAMLAPTHDETCTASYSVTQADLDSGSISNTASATAADPGGSALTSDPSTAVVTVAAAPALTLVKSATPTTVTTEGQHVTYHFLVTNTGNLTVASVTVKEGAFTGSGALSAIVCPDAALAPGAHEVCTADYVITGHDLTLTTITNTAAATGTAGARAVSSAPSTAKLTVERSETGSGSGSGSGTGGDSDSGTGGLSDTGVDAMSIGGIALALLLAGGLVLVAGRRRRHG